ncbi:MAG: hypothetical protein ACK4WC_09465 [Rubrimonas sp.]
MDAQRLRQPAALQAAVAASPSIRLVACGHVQCATITGWAGRPAAPLRRFHGNDAQP